MIIKRCVSALTDQVMRHRIEFLADLADVRCEKNKIMIKQDGNEVFGVSNESTPFSLLTSKQQVNVIAALAQYNKSSTQGTSSEPGLLIDLTRPLIADCSLEFINFEHPLGQQVFWHSSAHILGAALEIFTKGLLANGPALSSGFYYDVDSFHLTASDLEALEVLCAEIIKQDLKFQRYTLNKTQALELFAYNPFKLHFIRNKIAENGAVGVYKLGQFVDLCAGPHVYSSGVIKALKLTETSAVHWLNKADSTPLQRVYGISFPNKAQLDSYISHQKSLLAKDHRKLGSNLYFWHPFSAGSAFFLPDGAKLYSKLISFIRSEYRFRGFTEVISPNLFNISLWKQSGHYSKYKQDMFTLTSQDEELGLKPMNCPGHCLIFAHSQHSYKDLPIRLAEFGVLHRNEVTGSLSGLTRVRRFVQDDSHIFCTTEQIGSEVKGCIEFLDYIYAVFGFEYEVELSTKPENALGSQELWENAEGQLRKVLDLSGIFWKECKGEGAFYGPKIDFKVKDLMGRKHQCGTIQLDFNLPKRFNLQYKAQGVSLEERVVYEDMEEREVRNGFARPVIIHRAILGSLERMIAILTEHYEGKWPFWISPRQVCIVPVSEKHLEYALSIKNKMVAEGFCAELDESNASLNKKIRKAQMEKFNFVAVVGDLEVESGTVSLRDREEGQIGSCGVEQVLDKFRGLSPKKSKAQEEFEKTMWKSN